MFLAADYISHRLMSLVHPPWSARTTTSAVCDVLPHCPTIGKYINTKVCSMKCSFSGEWWYFARLCLRDSCAAHFYMAVIRHSWGTPRSCWIPGRVASAQAGRGLSGWSQDRGIRWQTPVLWNLLSALSCTTNPKIGVFSQMYLKTS